MRMPLTTGSYNKDSLLAATRQVSRPRFAICLSVMKNLPKWRPPQPLKVTIYRHMFHLVLYEPEIPPNTGNLIRLCANTGFTLHLVEPLGFSVTEKAFRRAGLDYHEAASMQIHANLEAALAKISPKPGRIFACTTKGATNYAELRFQPGDTFLFGPETRGLPDNVLEDERVSFRLRIPMRDGSRSLNLSNAVAIVAFEAWRQNQFGAS